MKSLLPSAWTVMTPVGLALLLGSCGGAGSEPGPDAPSLADLRAVGYAGEDAAVEGSRTGVTVHDPSQAWRGLNLYADQGSRCLALDMEGRPVHQWTVPGHDRLEHFVLLEEGRIAALSVDQGVTLLDRDSQVIWQRDLAAHHDLAVLPHGGLVVAVHSERQHAGRRVRFDSLVELDAGGRTVARWDTWEHLEELRPLHPAHLLDTPAPEPPEPAGPAGPAQAIYDYYHLNTITVLPASPLGARDPRFRAGNLLLCFRNVNLLVVLDRETLAVRWHWGPGQLDFPHHPTWTPEDRVLVFDNGRHRGRSRVIEVDPTSGAIAWSFEREGFFSDIRGACQRLANGNTLITESERGRVFEVTRAGALVWEYLDPDRRRIYRLQRVSPQALR